jgi:hypothetical protein
VGRHVDVPDDNAHICCARRSSLVD